jgi:hypothetical protein
MTIPTRPSGRILLLLDIDIRSSLIEEAIRRSIAALLTVGTLVLGVGIANFWQSHPNYPLTAQPPQIKTQVERSH